MEPTPLSVVLVGTTRPGGTPSMWMVTDWMPDASFDSMTLPERAALRALLCEAVKVIDRTDPRHLI